MLQIEMNTNANVKLFKGGKLNSLSFVFGDVSPNKYNTNMDTPSNPVRTTLCCQKIIVWIIPCMLINRNNNIGKINL